MIFPLILSEGRAHILDRGTSALRNETGESSNKLPTVTDTYYRSYAYGKYFLLSHLKLTS